MAQKAVPEYMKRYMENIGDACFIDYDLLSQEYHKSIQVYHEIRFPSRIPLRGGPSFKQDVNADLSRIEEQFKARALDIACEKYGYKDPGYQSYDRDLTESQEGGLYNHLSKDDFGLTAEDLRAKRAHELFEKNNPDKMVYKDSYRAVIDYYYSGPDGPSERKPESPSKSPEQKQPERTTEKEPRSEKENEAFMKDFIDSGKDTTQAKNRFSMSDRFFMSMGLNQNISNDKNNIEIEKDI